MLYEYTGTFDDFPSFREVIERSGVEVLSVVTVDGLLRVEVATEIPADLAVTLTLVT